MRSFLFVVLGLFGSLMATGQSVVGSWKGDLSVNGVVLPLVVHIQQTDSAYTASADSPAQGAFAIPAKVEVRQDSVDIAVQGGIYVRGRLTNDSTMNTTFLQGGLNLPLVLKRQHGEKPSEKLNRPQEPQLPYPYDSEDFVITKDSATVFGGTITSPKASGKYPAVILVSGSGQQDRDELLFGHKPFKVLADYLTKNGFVVLRFDDLGIGESKGDIFHLTTLTQSDDVDFLLDYLTRYPKVDKDKLGLIGHSEGGIIAPIVASQDNRVRYIVSLAGMAIPGYDLLKRQMADSGGLEVIPVEKKELYEDLIQTIKNSEQDDSCRHALQSRIDRFAKTNTLTAEDTIGIRRLFSLWVFTFVRLDPAVYLRQLTIPVMALNGAKDVQVIAQDNITAFKKYLPAHKKHVFKIYPNLNHLFQTAETGALIEYATIEETFHEPVMKDIVAWIKSL